MSAERRMYTDLAKQIELARDAARRAGAGWLSELAPAASPVQIEKTEAQLSTQLSPSHRAFLLAHNGSYFALDPRSEGRFQDLYFSRSSYSFGVQILSCEELVALSLEQRAFLTNYFASRSLAEPPEFLVIARYGGEGDLCVADPERRAGGEYPILDAFHEDPESWKERVIAASFHEWLDTMLASVGKNASLLNYWMNERIDDIPPSLD